MAGIIIIVIVVAAVAAYYITSMSTVPPSTSVSTTGTMLQPQNSSLLVDDALVPPLTSGSDSVDPAVGFTLGDTPVFSAVFQPLVAYNGSDTSHVVPVIAAGYSIQNNYQTYVFTIRSGVTFSNGDPVTAAVVWFSFARILLIGQGPGVADYVSLLFPANFSISGYSSPWGVDKAINAATGLPTNNDPQLTANALGVMLSNFDPSNSTIAKIISYPNQALVALNSTTIEFNLLNPYTYFLSDLASGWGSAIQDPVFIDAHGGVQPNAANSYLTNNPEPGTGPYILTSYTPGTQVVLEINPNYWGKSLQNPSIVDEPAHIPTIVVNYGEGVNNRLNGFVHNQIQISYVEPQTMSQLPGETSTYLVNTGPSDGPMYLAFNTQLYPMNITDLRLALVHAVNYTSIVHDVCKDLCVNYLGPVVPYFKNAYDPGQLSPYSYDLSLARMYINESGWEGHFNVVLPDGTVLGDPNAKELPSLTIDTSAPLDPFVEAQFSVIQSGWEQIGVAVALQAVTASVLYGPQTTAQGTPLMQFNSWYPDWPDPVYQIMLSVTGPAGGNGGNYAWFFNQQLLALYNTMPFTTNESQRLQMITEAYKIIYDNAPYLWIPSPEMYFLVQPYVKGFTFNPYSGYYYNAMYY
jgi:ABC-type transport system substrate-binding protein